MAFRAAGIDRAKTRGGGSAKWEKSEHLGLARAGDVHTGAMGGCLVVAQSELRCADRDSRYVHTTVQGVGPELRTGFLAKAKVQELYHWEGQQKKEVSSAEFWEYLWCRKEGFRKAEQEGSEGQGESRASPACAEGGNPAAHIILLSANCVRQGT